MTANRPAGPIRAVLFDVDDTLVAYSAAERAAIAGHLTDLGIPGDLLPATTAEWHRLQEHHFARYLAGRTDFPGQQRARVAGLLRWLDRPVPDDAGLTAWFAAYRRHHRAALRPYPDVAGCLAALADAGTALGVITNTDAAAGRSKLAHTGLLPAFRCIVGVDSAGRAKPDPAIFRYACARLGLPPHQVAYVGDKPDTDAAAATAAGLLGIWLDRRSAPSAGPSADRPLPAGSAAPDDLGSDGAATNNTYQVVRPPTVRIADLADLTDVLAQTAAARVTSPTPDLI